MLILKEKYCSSFFGFNYILEDNRLLGSAVGAALGGLVGAQFGGRKINDDAGAGSFLGGEIADRMTETETLNESLNNTAKG